jgi:hypothetical protein
MALLKTSFLGLANDLLSGGGLTLLPLLWTTASSLLPGRGWKKTPSGFGPLTLTVFDTLSAYIDKIKNFMLLLTLSTSCRVT